MRPEQLPIDDRYFTAECDYRVLYQNVASHLHAVIHFRRPGRDFKVALAKIVAAQKLLGVTYFPYQAEAKARDLCRSYDHFAVAISSNGACYIGRSQTNLECGDKYSRRQGFRLAVKKAFENMSRGFPVDFEIGIEPPTGPLLNKMVSAKLAQFKI
jgi:hypothetical protein